MTRAAAAVLLGLLVTVPARADEFCAALDKVIAAAPTGFAGIRGEADAQRPAFYFHAFALPDASALNAGGAPCMVVHAPNTMPADHYRCYFPGSASPDGLRGDMKVFAARVAACVGAMTYTPGGDFNIGDYRASRGRAVLRVDGALPPPDYGGGAVVLTIEPAT